MEVSGEKNFQNPKDLKITYKDKEVKIGDLTDEEKIDCISQLWLHNETLEEEKEVLKEMIQKMYFYGKMENLQDEKNG